MSPMRHSADPCAAPHPGAPQTAAMATVLPPATTYQPKLPKALINQGKLSVAPLEAVVYAGQAHAPTSAAKLPAAPADVVASHATENSASQMSPRGPPRSRSCGRG